MLGTIFPSCPCRLGKPCQLSCQPSQTWFFSSTFCFLLVALEPGLTTRVEGPALFALTGFGGASKPLTSRRFGSLSSHRCLPLRPLQTLGASLRPFQATCFPHLTFLSSSHVSCLLAADPVPLHMDSFSLHLSVMGFDPEAFLFSHFATKIREVNEI